jgi:thiosulfate reductase cytochrome b subunit
MTDDRARNRYFTIQAVRFAGVVQILLALVVLEGKLDWPGIIGYLLLANGLADVFLIPRLMAKRWRSPDR